MKAPRGVVFAGPNGAGKSTHAEAILEALGIRVFVNTGYIARGLSAVRVAECSANHLVIHEPSLWKRIAPANHTPTA